MAVEVDTEDSCTTRTLFGHFFTDEITGVVIARAFIPPGTPNLLMGWSGSSLRLMLWSGIRRGKTLACAATRLGAGEKEYVKLSCQGHFHTHTHTHTHTYRCKLGAPGNVKTNVYSALADGNGEHRVRNPHTVIT